jgi:uncharacterized protein (DUF2235 family)
MPKTIVFCADGTWNGPEDQTKQSTTDTADTAGELQGATLTNVVKLYSNLAGRPTPETITLHNEQEKKLVDDAGDTVQIAKYMHGVGNSNNAAMKVLGGVFGIGVIARIVRGYTFISRNYQAGDAIHITGFSRGAYTARALAGMIGCVGLLDTTRYDVNDKEEAYRRGVAAWNRSKGITLTGNSGITRLANRLLDFVEDFVARIKLKDADLISNVNVKSVGVWDTVGSMGMPLYIHDSRCDVFRFVDTALNPRVEFGFHAMAIDEQRADFPVTPWNRRTGVEQVWFTGAHADVGGGYAAVESRLSDAALAWMMKKLAGVGVNLATPLTIVPDFLSDPRTIHKPWMEPPFKLLARASRKPQAEDQFHASVIQRWKSDATYRPAALTFVTPQNIDRLTVQA